MNWIVVADSDADNLRKAGQILCRQQMRMTGFNSAQALLDFLRDNRPDLILLGNVLWELGGFEAISTLKRSMNGDIPVLLMADPDNRALAVQTKGAAGVVSKPLEPAALTAAVQGIFALRERRGQDETAPASSSLEEMEALLGKEGVTATVLNPVGFAEFDGVRLNVSTEGSYLEKEKKVKVSKVEGSKIIVKEIKG